MAGPEHEHLLKWRRQPPWGHQLVIDRSNPITLGLTFAWCATDPYVNPAYGRGLNTVHGATGITHTTRAWDGGGGRVVEAAGGTGGKFQFVTALETEHVTFFWIGGHSDAGVGDLGRPLSPYNGASAGRYDVYLSDFDNTCNFTSYRAGGAHGLWRSPASGVWVDGSVHAFAISYDGTATTNDPIFYLDSVVQTGIVEQLTPSGAQATASNLMAVCGRPDTTVRQLLGRMALALRFDRVLTPAEIRSLTDDPHQVYQPRRIWVPVSSSGTTVAVGQVTETDLAQPISAAQALTLGLVTETDTAQSITPRLTLALGLAEETDTAQPIAVAQQLAIGLAAETDVAQPVSAAQQLAIGQVVETDLAQPVDVSAAGALGLAEETDLAQPVAAHHALAIGLAQETDLAQPVVVVGGTTIGLAEETDLAQPIQANQILALGQATETDLAQPISAATIVAIGQASETDAAQPIVANLLAQLGIVSELDAALPVVAIGGEEPAAPAPAPAPGGGGAKERRLRAWEQIAERERTQQIIQAIIAMVVSGVLDEVE